MKKGHILGWHFTNGMNLRDGTKLEVGKTYTHEGDVKLCCSGYHASRRLIDALEYAPGAQVSRVECWGDVQGESEKLVARNRKVLWTLDATMILHEFSCQVAEEALAKAGNPDPRSVEAVAVKRRWMRGEASNKELSAAMDAAWCAAWDAARDAARYAAMDAAWDAARCAARYAARDALNEKLTAMVEEAHKNGGEK